MTTRDLDRIRFVTRHFNDLQGLRYWVPIGLLTLSVGGTTYFENRPYVILRTAFFLGAVILFFGARLYYRRAYGEVEWQLAAPAMQVSTTSVFSPAGPIQRLEGSPLTTPAARRFLISMGAAFTLFLILRAVSPPLEFLVDESLVEQPWHKSSVVSVMLAGRNSGIDLFPISKTAFAQTLYTLFGSFFLGMWLWRERRSSQSYYLALGILLLGLSVLGASLGFFYQATGEIVRIASTFEPLTVHLWVALLLCGSSMILVGFLDHWQLARTLGRQEK